ncbi:hypothetical protein [Ktedonobacter robiniae]|uniref:Uncharacterized protein n=1 Tax=Ktedonobacter robiniae TaxID=2778365 RepID=A0ABQ3ULL5_9CHLR|nr:hypothetical protein [Ktedonobacter robiniae]GHO53551.1 hypothetical protein KSB_20260 [Ktedonobacter robiniae]
MPDVTTPDAGHIWLSSQPQEYFLSGGLQVQPIPVLPPKPPTRMSRRKLLTLVGAGVISIASFVVAHYVLRIPL